MKKNAFLFARKENSRIFTPVITTKAKQNEKLLKHTTRRKRPKLRYNH